MADEPTILTEKRGRLAIVTLNRPAALNALTGAMMGAFNNVVAELERDPAVTAIVITGAGRGFCAGFDSAELVKTTETGLAERNLADRGVDEDLPAQFIGLLKVSKPVIAAVNGPAAGLGFILAMMCDLRFASDTAAFVTAFSKRGLIAEHGASWMLPRIVGPSRALDLLWSSRKVGADEALRIGLVDRVVPAAELLDAVAQYVDDIAANVSPRSLAIIKGQVYAGLSEPVGPAVREADRLTRESLSHPDSREGARSFVERRPPQFAPWTGVV
ncbi:enoyl-CoA hydratase/carnithine racemase [Caulobacter ginsengisoli]|uniref:Enoyl-CoA hydratase/carnithine racemase n=1 Tax=Caulobacter ginsengisoli TaxID=400775 RepID=A0ABU0IKN8_9CAUL|nr:enoyl-CoA hydratase-related protein [Caulobacter ginsengisoli]MDQ0462576.1 enoyl-CoA hydratase/carnithine racemase [Caulobacter ginsengisoli]